MLKLGVNFSRIRFEKSCYLIWTDFSILFGKFSQWFTMYTFLATAMVLIIWHFFRSFSEFHKGFSCKKIRVLLWIGSGTVWLNYAWETWNMLWHQLARFPLFNTFNTITLLFPSQAKKNSRYPEIFFFMERVIKNMFTPVLNSHR